MDSPVVAAVDPCPPPPPLTRASAADRRMVSVIEPVQAPWVRPGVVIHDPATPVDGLLAEFALRLRGRGFNVTGYVQRNNAGGAGTMGQGCATRIEFFDVATGEVIAVDRSDATFYLRKAMREDADLLVISRFQAFHAASRGVRAVLGEGLAQGMPVLTSIAGRCVHKLHADLQRQGTMVAPDLGALWRWWGPERLYQDLALGVADDEVRAIVCGGRWIMVEGTRGTGLAYLPRSARDLFPRLAGLQRQGLRRLAGLCRSWDPVEMALGIAAINAHYNCEDTTAPLHPGNGVRALPRTAARTVVIGAFPGLAGILPNSVVIETDPRPGEFPPVAMDTLLPGCGGAVVNSSALINRSLPRILRLAESAPLALIGPATPLTPRLFSYGIDVLGGLLVRDPAGLAAAIRAGASPREFTRFGQYQHLRRGDGSPDARSKTDG